MTFIILFNLKMKGTKMKILIMLLLFSCTVFAQGTNISILHTGDSHSHLDAFGPKDCSGKGKLGGIARVASVIGSNTTSNTLFLHAGDFMVGDFFFNKFFGVPELQLLQQMGCDAICAGNHEFDLGPEVLAGALFEGFANGSIPVVSANLDLTGFPPLQNFIVPYTIKNAGGVNVGIFGLTTPDPLNNPGPVIVQENIPEIAYATVIDMRANGANVVILLSHLGWENDSMLALGIPGIDFICGGHDHRVFRQPRSVTNPLNTQTLVMHTGSDYEHIGKLDFNYDGGQISFIGYELIDIDNSVPAVPEVQDVVDYLKQEIVLAYGNVFTQPVGFALHDIDQKLCNSNFKDTPIGNMLTDAQREFTRTDVSVTANGMIAEKIYRGKLNSADLFRTVPYGFDTITGLGFNLVKMKISGAMLVAGLEVGLSMIGISDDFFVQVSGMNFRYNPEYPVGSRVIPSSVRIGRRPLDVNKMYSLTVNEGILGILLASGIQVQDIEFTGTPEYSALKEFVRRRFFVASVSTGRIIDVSGDGMFLESNEIEETPACTYSLSDNYPNPFNPVTKISYQLPVASEVTIRIYDISGRQIAELVNSFQEQGKYEVSFDASMLSSGTYFYRMEAGEYSQTKKMTLIK